MMRINEWSVNFLTQATALPLLRPDIPLGIPTPNMEQDAMRWVLDQEGYKEHAVYQPRLWYNAFSHGPDQKPETKPGDMVIHFPGVEHKYPLMGHWLDIVENEPEKVNKPLSNLTLHTDIKGFWASLRTAKQALHNATEYLEADIVVQQVFKEHPGLGDDLKEASKKLERLFYEEPFQQKELKEAMLLVGAAMSRASKAKSEAERRKVQQEVKAKAEEEKRKKEEEKKKKQKEQEERGKHEEERKTNMEAEERKIEQAARVEEQKEQRAKQAKQQQQRQHSSQGDEQDKDPQPG